VLKSISLLWLWGVPVAQAAGRGGRGQHAAALCSSLGDSARGCLHRRRLLLLLQQIMLPLQVIHSNLLCHCSHQVQIRRRCCDHHCRMVLLLPLLLLLELLLLLVLALLLLEEALLLLVGCCCCRCCCHRLLLLLLPHKAAAWGSCSTLMLLLLLLLLLLLDQVAVAATKLLLRLLLSCRHHDVKAEACTVWWLLALPPHSLDGISRRGPCGPTGRGVGGGQTLSTELQRLT
jgi:hypothetical protein